MANWFVAPHPINGTHIGSQTASSSNVTEVYFEGALPEAVEVGDWILIETHYAQIYSINGLTIVIKDGTESSGWNDFIISYFSGGDVYFFKSFSTSGSHVNDGTSITSAFSGLDMAIAAASSGDTIYIRQGTLHSRDSLSELTIDKNLTFISYETEIPEEEPDEPAAPTEIPTITHITQGNVLILQNISGDSLNCTWYPDIKGARKVFGKTFAAGAIIVFTEEELRCLKSNELALDELQEDIVADEILVLVSNDEFQRLTGREIPS